MTIVKELIIEAGLQPWCPKCGASEIHPTRDKWILIRACKVFNEGGTWSQCLVCSGHFNNKLEVTTDNHDPDKGWFCENF